MHWLIVLFCFFLSGTSQAATPGKYFQHVVMVVFENNNIDDVMKQPFFKELAKKGVNLANISAVTHPSQPNYIAMASGALYGVSENSNYDLEVKHIADLLEAKGYSWRVYAEDFPGNCYTGNRLGDYVRKHNPFISFLNVQKNPKRCANIVSGKNFFRDFAQGRLPHYSFFIPNLKNDAHDTGMPFANKWYKRHFARVFKDAKRMQDTLVITTFDENAGADGNKIYTSFNGPVVKAGAVVVDALTHYSILKLVEENWGLGDLGQGDTHAPAVPTSIWRK